MSVNDYVLQLQIRIFPTLEKTIQYAKMLERAGAWIVAVHGRTREQKDAKQVKANWAAIRVIPLFQSPICLALHNLQNKSCMSMLGAPAFTELSFLGHQCCQHKGTAKVVLGCKKSLLIS